ncbi:helix-turn-helix transcriptional regulator [Thermopolyspora sp. NPDC052614]|uniref:helix-turn-helix domain-containing protein n=1 Tax=Thermopolyspora sp. NPDC052614 TaxID=3155682 RepID=UPI0034306B2A
MGAESFGQALRRLRGDLSIRELARRANCGKSYVCDLEQDRRSPSGQVAMALDKALGAGGLLVALAASGYGGVGTVTSGETVFASITAPGLPWVWEPKLTVDAVYAVSRDDLMLERRQAVQMFTVTAGIPLIDPAQLWLGKVCEVPVSSCEGRIGNDEVERLEQTVSVFRSWDDSHGGGLARKAVIGQLNEVADLLRESHPRHITVRLFSVLAQLAKIAATMSWDCGMQTAAQKYYVLGLQASKPTGDRSFGAGVLASMARQLLCLDKPHDALELVRLALDGVGTTATPRLRAMLHTREAWAYAKLGRAEAFKRATGAAEEAFSEVRLDDADPEWITYFDEAELAGVTGHRYLELSFQNIRYTTHALTRIGRALELRKRSSMRSFALDQLGLAHVHLLKGDVDEAVAVAGTAMESVGQVQSDRVRVKLRKIYVEISKRRDPVVSGLREQLREMLAR